jgi:ADP-ribose pyrophosphatase
MAFTATTCHMGRTGRRASATILGPNGVKSEPEFELNSRAPIVRLARLGESVKKNAAVQVVSSELIFKGRVMEVKRDQIIEPSGIKATREWVKHPGSVVVLPVFPDGRILLIRQYRYAAAQEMWELVAGHKEPDEDFETGAHRELEEEVGYTARKLKKLLEFFPSPGFLSEKMVVFLAEGLTKGKSNPEDDEKIDQRIVTLSQAEEWIRKGKIRDAKTVAGILFYSKFAAAKKKNRK